MKNLHIYIFPDLLPWERASLSPLVKAFVDKGAKEIVVSPNDRVVIKRSDNAISWVISRDWKRARNLLGGGDFFSLLNFNSERRGFFSLLWTDFIASDSDVKLIAHSPLEARFRLEIEKRHPQKIAYLPFPAPRIAPSHGRLTSRRSNVGAFGEFTPHENMHFFLNVAHYVASKDKAVDFWILGRGPLETHLRRMAADLGVEDRVHVHPTDDIAVISELDLLLYVPMRNSHFLPVLTAGEFDVPVLSTEVEGVSEMIEDARSGFIVPMHETKPMGELVLRLIGDKTLSRSLGQGLGAKVRESFSVEHLLSLYAKHFGLHQWARVERAA